MAGLLVSTGHVAVVAARTRHPGAAARIGVSVEHLTPPGRTGGHTQRAARHRGLNTAMHGPVSRRRAPRQDPNGIASRTARILRCSYAVRSITNRLWSPGDFEWSPAGVVASMPNYAPTRAH